MKKRIPLLCGLAAISGFAIGYVNINSNEVQPPVFIVLVFSFLFGSIDPKRAWLWAAILGSSVPLSYALAPIFRYPVPYPPDPNIFASFIAFIPAFIGAYAGVLVRWLAFNTASQQ